MKRHSWTISFLLISTSLAHAQSGAEEAFSELIRDLNQSGLFTAEVGSMHYQEDGDVLTAQNVTYKFDWSLPGDLMSLNDDLLKLDDQNKADGSKSSAASDGSKESDEKEDTEGHISMTMTVPTITATGMRLELDGVSYDTMSYEGHQFLVTIDMPGTDNDATIKGTGLGKDEMVNGYQPFLGKFEIASDRPIGSVLDYMRPLLLKPHLDEYTSAGYTTTQLTGKGVVTEEAELGPLTMKNMRDGKIESYELAYQKGEMPLRAMMAGQTESDETPDQSLKGIPEKLTYEVGKTTYKDYNIAAMLAAIDPNLSAQDDNAMVLSEVNTGPITMTATDLFEFSIAPSVMKDFALKQPQTYIVPLIDELIAKGQSPENLPAEQKRALFRAGFDLLRGFSLGLSENGEIKAKGTMPEGKYKGQTIEASIGKLHVSDISAEGVGEVSLSGVTYGGPPSIQLSLGRLALENLEFANYDEIENFFMRRLEGQDPTSAEMAKIAPEGFDIAISDLSYQDAKDNKVSLASLKTGMKRQGLAIPALFTSKIDELTISKSLLRHPLASVLMTQLNLDSLTFNQDIKIAWDENSETVNVDPLSIELMQIAKLSGNLGFGGIIRNYLDNPEMAQAAMMTGTIQPSNLTLADLGGLDNLIDLAGVTTGMGPDQVREFASSQAQATLSAFTKPDFAKAVGGEIRAFLSDPKSLKIMLNPGAPVPVMQVLAAMSQDPGTIPDLLNIGVAANEN
ncbi:hypothetical protein SAMN04515647_4123 [Cohaesibacter sp. ES.047]|uniref:hypothetical protein n=1 Tax=Cohaesibacter sp. ES.047 TaxID=1798205 RepID=UPI000BB92A71|nr:hypothetical protein [Cohaesibacter sp. ES.047]SNY93802.1 hypothetical protein SAMN04515647_4123 [Cohaesibacter sp. ES.047]